MEIENILNLLEEDEKEYVFNYMERNEETLAEAIAEMIGRCSFIYSLRGRRFENNM